MGAPTARDRALRKGMGVPPTPQKMGTETLNLRCNQLRTRKSTVFDVRKVSTFPNVYVGTNGTPYSNAKATKPLRPSKTTASRPFSVRRASASPPGMIARDLPFAMCLAMTLRLASKWPVQSKYSRMNGTLKHTVAPQGCTRKPGNRFSSGDACEYRGRPPYGKMPWGCNAMRYCWSASSLTSSPARSRRPKYSNGALVTNESRNQDHSLLQVFSAPPKKTSR
mmetsp:Transcript_91358/g.267346  ORF Transcript_91358/g.267346 Transcript_91358/m.267346 type:complete len:223 (-) Transcript_91358:276-944(-)